MQTEGGISDVHQDYFCAQFGTKFIFPPFLIQDNTQSRISSQRSPECLTMFIHGNTVAAWMESRNKSDPCWPPVRPL